MVIDLNSQNYEVGLRELRGQPTITDYALGERFFGHLQVTTRPLEFFPGSNSLEQGEQVMHRLELDRNTFEADRGAAPPAQAARALHQ
jgi:hypothetical protein